MNRQTLRRAAIPVAVVLCIAFWIWPQVQGIATILLLLVTLEYVLLAQENIELFRRQLARQEKVYMDFELVCRHGPLLVRVANLGISNFLVTGIHVRTQDIAEFNYSVHEVVQSGKIQEVNLPREVCADYALSVDLEITVEYLGLDVPGKTEPKCFNVGMALDNIPDRTKKGLDGLWTVACPSCGLGGLIAMSLRGLNTLEEAFARKKQTLEDFKNSCPSHASKWLLAMDEAEHP